MVSMKKVFHNNKKFFILTILIVVITSLTKIITPSIILLLQNENEVVFSYFFLFVFCSMFLSFLIQLFLLIYRENYAAHFNTQQLLSLMEKVYRMKYDAILEREPTFLVNRIYTVIDTFYLFITGGFASLIGAFFTIFFSIVISYWIHPLIFIILLLVMPVNFFGFRFINRKLKEKMDCMHVQSAHSKKDLIAIMGNVDQTKSVGEYPVLSNLYSSGVEEMYTTLADTNKFAQGSSSAISFINQLAQNLIFIGLSYNIASGLSELSNLIVVSIVLPLFFSSLGELSRANIDLRSIEVARAFIREELEENREQSGKARIATIEEIGMETLSYEIKGKKYEVEINQHFHKGDRIYLSGDSGSGKSSLLKLLVGFRPAKGLYVNTVPMGELEKDCLRSQIAYISQEPILFSKTLEENVGFGRKLSPEEKIYLEETGILTTILQGKNWDSRIEEGGANLSGGEKQRIAVARVLIQDPTLILLDEATSNIDHASSQQIMDTIVSFAQDCILFYTSHDQVNSKYATKVIHIDAKGN